jgi:toxin ParE1/3/4
MQIRTTVLRLCEFPESGRVGDVAGTRELVVSGIPYIVVYRVIGDSVEILRVFHTSMDRSNDVVQ